MREMKLPDTTVTEDYDEELALFRNLSEWQSHDYRGTESNIHSLSPQVLKQIRRFTKSFKQAYSKMAEWL